jgi:DNA-binding Lrp family transcriptional regulator
MRPLDDIDRHILTELQTDGRLSNQDLADRVGLSPSPCLRRVRMLEDDNVITGYRAEVDQRDVGLAITAFVQLTLDSHSSETVDRVEEEIRSIPEVVEAYVLAGDSDYLLRVTTASFETYEDLMRRRLRRIPSLASIQTTFAFGVTKRISPLAIR